MMEYPEQPGAKILDRAAGTENAGFRDAGSHTSYISRCVKIIQYAECLMSVARKWKRISRVENYNLMRVSHFSFFASNNVSEKYPFCYRLPLLLFIQTRDIRARAKGEYSYPSGIHILRTREIDIIVYLSVPMQHKNTNINLNIHRCTAFIGHTLLLF